MLRQLIGGEDVFLLGYRDPVRVLVRVEGIHNQCPLDLNRFFRLLIIEVDAAAKPPHARLGLLIQNRVGPNRHDPFRYGGFFGTIPRPGIAQFPLRTTRE